VTLEESTTYPEGAGAGNALGDDNAVLVDGSAVRAVCEEGRSLGEVGNTGDAGVLLVEVLLDDLLLGLSDGGKDVRLSLVVTVGAKPRLIFWGLESFLKASVMPRMASGGP